MLRAQQFPWENAQRELDAVWLAHYYPRNASFVRQNHRSWDYPGNSLSAKSANAAKLRVRRKASAKVAADEIVIPDRLYFRIGEVARLCRLPAYVLRFWETEFPQLRPTKSSTGQRMYRRSDVENVLRIKRLLYEEGFTIPGARQHLSAERKASRSQAALPFVRAAGSEEIRRVRQGLKELLAVLSARAK